MSDSRSAIHPNSSDGPDYIPVRMLNEYVYCPRLCYLEWVQGEFAENDYVTHGLAIHRRVDRPAGAAPLPCEDGVDGTRETEARALTLSSETLGIIGKLDRVEFDGKLAIPVETKRGEIPSVDEGTPVLEPEQVQLCAQGLLLRDNGYDCTHGEVYFAGSRRRISVSFDSGLIEKTQAAIEAVRAMARAGLTPPPLIDSPKCVGCSLAPICLPDEVNLLAGRRTRTETRRFNAPNLDAKPLYVTEPGARVGVSGETVTIRERGASSKAKPIATIRLIDISSLHVLGNAQVSSQALAKLLEREIPVLWQSGGGWLYGIAHGMGHKNIELRQAQFHVAADPRASLALARQFIVGKIRNARTLMRRNHQQAPNAALRELTRLVAVANKVDSLESLFGVEGAAARVYFQHFGDLLRPSDVAAEIPFDFKSRNRRPPTDPTNCVLSFAYSLLVREVTTALLATGFDPYLGFFHQSRYSRPSLALDLMEELRPLIADSVTLTVINRGEVQPQHIVKRGPACNLTPAGRRAVTAAFERRMATELTHPIFDYQASYRRVVAMQARLLARVLLGEIEHYPAITTR